MANVLLMPLSGNIYFDHGAHQASTVPDLIHCGVSLGYDGCAGVKVTSFNPAASATDRFTVAGESGSLFSVNDSLTGTVFSVNDASGLPIIEVNSNATTDTIAIGEYGTNALFVSGGNVGVGTATPTSPLHVCGNIAVTGTVDGRDIVADGSKLDGIACGAGTGTVTEVRGCTNISVTNGTSVACVNMSTGGAGAGTYGSTSNSCKIDSITLDAYGRVTAVACGSTCIGDITGVTAGTGMTGGGTSGAVTLNVIGGTGITANANDMALTPAGPGAGVYGSSANGCKIDCITLDAYGRVTSVDSGPTGTVTSIGISPGTGLDAGNAITSSGTISVTLDLSELTDMTAAVAPASDELILLDSGAERRKLFCEVFGDNAYNSTTIPTNNNQLTNGCSYIKACDSITGNAATATNSTCAGGLAVHTGTNNEANKIVRTQANGYINAGWINTISGNSGSTALTRVYASHDGYIRYYSIACFGAQIGSHINYNCLTSKPTIPSNNNQLSNGCGYTTCTGNVATTGATFTGTINSRDIKLASGYHLQRSDHHSGHFEGSYNNIGANNSKSNPIYTIGSSYNPTDAALSNMYGIGYTNCSASFISKTGAAGWGMYVAADGDARVWLDGSNGAISSSGEHYVGSSRVFHDTYHPNADKLTTARTIAGTSFDGTANISINYNCLTNKPTIPTGDITGVTAGTGMTGGGSSGTPTLNVIGGDGITANADNIVVDCTVVRTTGAQTIAGVKTYSSRGDFSNADGVRTNQLRTYGGQQLVLNAGESSSYATGQTAECVFINAEAGLEINSTPDNWSSGWAGRRTSYINNTSGNSHFYGSITLGGNVDGRNVANDGSKLDGIACGATANTGDITAVTAGAGLTGGGTSGSVTVCHNDTSSQGSVNNSSGTVIQDVTLDTYGHVTALGSTNLDSRYYTESEVNTLLAGKLSTSGCAANSQLLDGIDSSAFLRSNTADTFTGSLTMGTQKALIANNYGRGVYGLYSSTKYQHVWSMGTSYNLCDDGSGPGNLYGLAFTHTNVGGQSKPNLQHQLLVMQNGLTCSAIGAGIWTNGTITANNGNIVLGGTGRIQGVDTVSSSTDAANKAYVDNGLATKQASGTYNTIIGTDSDINTSGCQVVDQLVMTDGVITSHSTRNITLANLGYTGATNANNITNNNQLTNGAGYITSSGTANNATCAGGLVVGTGRNNSANQIVRTNSSGYAEFGWINTTSGANTTQSFDRIYASSDSYIRYYSPACFGIQIGQYINYNCLTSKPTIPTNNNQLTNGNGYTTCTGNVVTTGATFTGNVTLNDSVCLRIGSSADLSLFHNGNHSYIDNDKNSLYIRNNVDGDDGGDIYIMPHDNENGIVINDDSRVDLYFDNALRFCTQCYGTRTTGTVCASYDVKAPFVCGANCVYGGQGKFCNLTTGGQGINSNYAITAGNCASCGCGCSSGGSILALGNVNICGTLAKSSGCFDITHPLPALSATKRLSHSFVESPQADNIYSGVVQLTGGSASVNIDEIHGMTSGTLTALNRCFRTFTTNETNWDPVRGSVTDNTLTIESCVADSTATVSWMVLGERHDPHMLSNEHTDNEGRARVEYTPPANIYSEGKWVSV